MGRFRTANNNICLTSGEYNTKIKGLKMIEYAKTSPQNKSNNNFVLDDNTGYITHFDSYDNYLTTAKAASLLPNISCSGENKCTDVPITINQGLHSQINYADTLLTDNNCNTCTINMCEERKNVLYPYGTYTNNHKSSNLKFPATININNYDCTRKSPCPKYEFCECSTYWDPECCKYQVVYPTPCGYVYNDVIPNATNSDTLQNNCCSPIIENSPCINCNYSFSPTCKSGYNCPGCDYRYDTGHYYSHLDKCNNCDNEITLNPYFESECANCNAIYKPHGEDCTYVNSLCSKEKLLYAFSTRPKVASADVINNTCTHTESNTGINTDSNTGHDTYSGGYCVGSNINETSREKYFRLLKQK